MSLQPNPTLSFEEWLEGERASLEGRSEYVAGEVFAMTGASIEHNGIVANMVRELGTQFKKRPCQVCANDMKVYIRSADAGKYPDLVAFCGDPEFHDGRRDVLLNPSLIVEVLADSTEAYDRGDKFFLYRQIPSLREYLLVSQHRVLVELFVRTDRESLDLDGVQEPRRPSASGECGLHSGFERGLRQGGVGFSLKWDLLELARIRAKRQRHKGSGSTKVVAWRKWCPKRLVRRRGILHD